MNEYLYSTINCKGSDKKKSQIPNLENTPFAMTETPTQIKEQKLELETYLKLVHLDFNFSASLRDEIKH